MQARYMTPDAAGLDGYLAEVEALVRATRAAGMGEPVARAVDAIVAALGAGRPLLVCGNGGSAADALHIAGELVGRFLQDRPGLRCHALTADPAFLTAWSNDKGYDSVFARQVETFGEPGAVLLGLSTSGNSANVLRAFESARVLDMTTIALTGRGGGRLAPLADILVAVPSDDTPHIQEMHACLYHFICGEVERRLAPQR